MRFQQKKPAYQGSSARYQFVLPLVPPKISSEDLKDKTKFVTFDLKVKAGGAAASPSYKKSMRTFEEGTPQEWIDVLSGLKEIWLQNSVTGPTDRAATVLAILKGDSRSNFETALEDARVDPGGGAPLAMTTDMIETALLSVTTVVFPFRALEVQKQWMNRSMKKPYDLSASQTKNAITRLNNALPYFPLGSEASKFTDAELIGLFEFSIPQRWRDIMDAKGFVASMGSMKLLLEQCQIIERTEAMSAKAPEDNSNRRDTKFAKSDNSRKKSDRNNNKDKRTDGPSGERGSGKYYCTECGKGNHSTDRCSILKARQGNGAHAGPKPYSKRTFRKEVNAIARRAGKHDGLGIFAQALKREEKKATRSCKPASKNRTSSKRAARAAAKEDSSSSESESDESIHLMDTMDSPIPRKHAAAAWVPTRVATRVTTRVPASATVRIFPYTGEAAAPTKKKAPKNDIFAALMDCSSDEDEVEVLDVVADDNKPTAEEKAFLMSIDKKEKKNRVPNLSTMVASHKYTKDDSSDDEETIFGSD